MELDLGQGLQIDGSSQHGGQETSRVRWRWTRGHGLWEPSVWTRWQFASHCICQYHQPTGLHPFSLIPLDKSNCSSLQQESTCSQFKSGLMSLWCEPVQSWETTRHIIYWEVIRGQLGAWCISKLVHSRASQIIPFFSAEHEAIIKMEERLYLRGRRKELWDYGEQRHLRRIKYEPRESLIFWSLEIQ